MGQGDEPGSLKRPPRGAIRWGSARRRDGAPLVTFPLQFLDPVGADAAPTKGFSPFHVDVGVGPVVMEEEANLGGPYSVHLQHPFPSALPSFQAGTDVFRGGHRAEVRYGIPRAQSLSFGHPFFETAIRPR